MRLTLCRSFSRRPAGDSPPEAESHSVMPFRLRPAMISPILIAAAAAVTGAAPAGEEMVFTPSQKSHWAWKRPARPAIPTVRNAAWPVSPLDTFILAKLEAQGLSPAPPATREALIRRVAFDLTGLPPTPEEIDGFLADRAPGAWERVVDRSLASPAFGERWARHWLDLARYADTNGYEHDEVRPDAWRYRDYVVRSLNADKPYDRFIMEQLAGDELFPSDPDARIATGFNLLGPDMTDAADQTARRQNTLNDMTDTASLVFLGLTAGCARCHDHKYEPISQQDYYRIQSFFAPARFRKDLPAGTALEQSTAARAVAEHDRAASLKREELRSVAGEVHDTLRDERIARLPEDVQTAFRLPQRARTADQQNLVDRHARAAEPPSAEVEGALPEAARARYRELVREIRTLEGRRPPPPPTALGLDEQGADIPATHILVRGETAHRGKQVEPGFPVILSRVAPTLAPPGAYGSGRRSVLARWIASPANPLTARVMANRVWQHLFGRGIVATPSDFGVRGESPTHPELLDFLATSFASGRGNGNPSRPWSLKRLIRGLVLSSTYRQSTRAPAATLGADPENALFSRMNRRRLEAEAVRDAALAVSGLLNSKPGGPGVFAPIPDGARPSPAAWPVSQDAADHVRRSLYLFVRRNLIFPAFESFDAPDTNLSCARREVSTTAPQALALMNAPDMRLNAQAFAARVLRAGSDTEKRIVHAYRLALARPPSRQELDLAVRFLGAQAALVGPSADPAASEQRDSAAYVDLCLALLNVNEFVYID